MLLYISNLYEEGQVSPKRQNTDPLVISTVSKRYKLTSRKPAFVYKCIAVTSDLKIFIFGRREHMVYDFAVGVKRIDKC